MTLLPRKIITKTILLVSFVSLFTDVASEMLYPVMPVYLRSIGFTVLLIGILEGFAEATAGLTKGYFGHLSDVRRRRVPFVQAGYAMSAISKPLMALFTWPLWIFFARTIDRFGKGIRTSARDAILSDETAPENKGKVFGFHRSMDTIGAAIGPSLALIFLYFYPGQYKWLFFIAFFPGILAILLTLFLKEPKHLQSRSTSRAETKVSLFSYFGYWSRANSEFRLLVGGLLAFTLFNSSDAFLLLALKNQGMTDTRMIGFYIFYNLVYALFSYPLGALADRIGLKTMLVAGLFLFALVYVGMGFAAGFYAFAALFMAYGIYAAATEGISKALISNLVEKRDTATAIGFFNSFSSIFALAASSMAGFLWFAAGPRVMFLVSGAGVFCVVLFLFVFFMRKKGNFQGH